MIAVARLLSLPLIGLLALYGWYFGAHAQALLAFPYPLDYGEGPLLLQARLLADGLAAGQLYGDPADPPYTVVNYPPLYLLLTTGLAPLAGDLLRTGRLVSLLAALACAAALFALLIGYRSDSDEPQPGASGASELLPEPRQLRMPGDYLLALLVALAFLALPVVRQWAVLMRVDMLGVALGLCGLVALTWLDQKSTDLSGGFGQAVLVACFLSLVACLLVASLYSKPSLLAAPAAGCLWLLARYPRRGLLLGLLLVGGGGLLFLLLQLQSGGWFALHAVAANANRWEPALAWLFWREQLLQLWPLALAGILSTALLLRAALTVLGLRGLLSSRAALPVLYTAGGFITALGVGKVGAYANYFLELYAGLLWLCGLLLLQARTPARQRNPFLQALALLALLAALARYYPLWDPLQPRQAGMLSPNPPRLAFGSYPLWADQRREWRLLETFAAWQQQLNAAAQAEPGPLFTDTPGLLVAAAVAPRLQAFEHRQLLDQQLWDQAALLRELANGELPLAVIDYLGNWLSPEMVTLLSQRYALDGSIGVYSLYRPLALGPRQELPGAQGGGLRLTAAYVAPSPGPAGYSPGETLALGLEWRRDGELTGSEVVVTLHSPSGEQIEVAGPLLYGAIRSQDWPQATALQHVQALTLPLDTLPGEYELLAALRGQGGEELLAPQPVARLHVGPLTGRVFDTGYFVPGTILATWQQLGGTSDYGPGLPLMPAVPFAHGVLQCFERVCLDQNPAGVTRRPLGELIGLDAPVWPVVPLPGASELPASANGIRLAAPFAPLWKNLGGESGAGQPVSPPLDRLGLTVQYTTYARLERAADGSFSLGRLGDDYLRLPPGARYPWPKQP